LREKFTNHDITLMKSSTKKNIHDNKRRFIDKREGSTFIAIAGISVTKADRTAPADIQSTISLSPATENVARPHSAEITQAITIFNASTFITIYFC